MSLKSIYYAYSSPTEFRPILSLNHFHKIMNELLTMVANFLKSFQIWIRNDIHQILSFHQFEFPYKFIKWNKANACMCMCVQQKCKRTVYILTEFHNRDASYDVNDYAVVNLLLNFPFIAIETIEWDEINFVNEILCNKLQ